MLTMICVEPREDYPSAEYHPWHLTDKEVREECDRLGVDFTPDDLDEMAATIYDQTLDECVVDVLPTEDFKRREKNDQRNKLEETAASLARQHGLQVNSLAFLDLLDRLIDKSRSYREGMKEDGLCIGYGVSPDQWQEEYNASSGDESRIVELKEWMLDNLPLLCAQYTERMTENDT
jgi:hypothetical protein